MDHNGNADKSDDDGEPSKPLNFNFYHPHSKNRDEYGGGVKEQRGVEQGDKLKGNYIEKAGKETKKCAKKMVFEMLSF